MSHVRSAMARAGSAVVAHAVTPPAWWPILALAVVAVGLAALDVVPVSPALPHVVALPPLDLFADVRLLYAEASGPTGFVAGLAVALTVRVLLVAAVLGSLGRRVVRAALVAYLAALPFALVAGGLAFSAVAARYALFLWVSIGVAVVVALVVSPLPWGVGWSGRARLVVGGYLVGLLVVSLVAAQGGEGARMVLTAVSAGLTWWAIRLLTRTGPTARGADVRPRPTVLAPLLVLALLVAPIASATAPSGPDASGPRRGSLLLVPGIGGGSGTNTMFELDPASLGYACAQTYYYSYAGPGDGAPQRDAVCPIRTGAPYGPDDTLRPVEELADGFRRQLLELPPPVAVVANSQGGWIAAAGLDGGGGDGTGAVVLIGAFGGLDAGYPLGSGEPGAVGTETLRGLTRFLRDRGWTNFDPDAPLAVDVMASGEVDDLVTRLADGPTPVGTVTSAFDLPVTALGAQPEGVSAGCPVFHAHGDLLHAPAVREQVRRILDGDEAGPCPWWRRWPTAAFAAFGAPTPEPPAATGP